MGITTDKLTRYSNSNKLGVLIVPNGQGHYYLHAGLASGLQTRSLGVSLTKVYNMLQDSANLNDIIAVLIHGSSVKPPGYTTKKYQKRKYVIFGPKINKTRKIYWEIHDMDLFVITKDHTPQEQHLKREVVMTHDPSLGPPVSWTKEAGIDLAGATVSQIINREINMDIPKLLTMGIPIIVNNEPELSKVYGNLCCKNKYKLEWWVDGKGYLNCGKG